MKFGIFYEISVSRPWTPEAEKKVYDNCFEQVKLADELGFDYVWAVEHHFLEEYSHCSAPEVFLTACAMITKRIRVGHGIVVCLPPINNPARIRNALPRWTSCRVVGSTSAPDAPAPGWRWALSA